VNDFHLIAQNLDVTAPHEVGAVRIASEPFTLALADEIAPLGQESWDECTIIKDSSCSFHNQRGFQIQPDIPQYLVLAASDMLLAMTLRDKGRLVGYALCIFYRSLHHQPIRCANVDTFFIQPGHRAYMRSFIGTMEDQFREREVVQIGWPTSPKGKLFDILQLLGYAPDDVIMEKKLDEGAQPCA